MKRSYRAVFVSPHLDDAVFSCGGRIAQLVSEGPVLVLNIFTRYLSDVKIRGVVLTNERFKEESAAAGLLGFESLCLDELDVSFRREAYKSLGNIFRPPIEEDLKWLARLRQSVFAVLDSLTFDEVFVPLGIGWHVDHVMTHMLFDSWDGCSRMCYYEDSPYCCIPHSTRYRLDELASYPRSPEDGSLAPTGAVSAWRQASLAYSKTALMRNLTPWVVRLGAIPVVSIYLFRLMALHRRLATVAVKVDLRPLEVSIENQFELKIEAMSAYKSQFLEFFSSRADCVNTLVLYGASIGHASKFVERYWHRVPPRDENGIAAAIAS